MLRALNGHHKVLNFEGELAFQLNGTENVDLEQPPEIEYFKFFYHRLGVPNAPAGVPLCRGGARFHSEPPAGAAQVLAPPININLPPKAFQFSCHLFDSHHCHSKHPLPSSSSLGSRESSPKFELELETHANVPLPTIEQWLRELEMQGVTYTRWDILRETFKNEDSLEVLISSIA
ncbi:hypothetical protein K439DRAFT_1625702 [Ramaria rubella]|nr:hypothetical protein K439DRAFT_1625702 [Ramaria rubella]